MLAPVLDAAQTPQRAVQPDQPAGEAEITVEGTPHALKAGDIILLPGGRPHAVSAPSRFKMVLTVIRE